MKWLAPVVRKALYRDWTAAVRRAREEYERHPFSDVRRIG